MQKTSKRIILVSIAVIVIGSLSYIFKKNSTGDSYTSFKIQNITINCFTGLAQAERIELFTRSFLAYHAPIFKNDTGALEINVFNNKEDLIKHTDQIKELKKPVYNMGFYNNSIKKGFCSMGWGLGWYGDILLRCLLERRWSANNNTPNEWLKWAMSATIYNCFRTEKGEFRGINIMSYYHGQVKNMILNKQLLSLHKMFSGKYKKDSLLEDQLFKQGRTFFAYTIDKGFYKKLLSGILDNLNTDPSGMNAIEEVFNQPIDTIQASWEKWILASVGEIGTSAMGKPYPTFGVLFYDPAFIKEDTGLKIFSVSPDGPGGSCGLLKEDVIIKINGQYLYHVNDLITCLEKISINTKVSLEILRNNKIYKTDCLLDVFVDGV